MQAKANGIIAYLNCDALTKIRNWIELANEGKLTGKQKGHYCIEETEASGTGGLIFFDIEGDERNVGFQIDNLHDFLYGIKEVKSFEADIWVYSDGKSFER